MKLSFNWLCELVPNLRKIPCTEVAHRLTMAGLEVEAIEDRTKKFEGIVVGEVLKKDRHPNADRLSVCEVSTGRETFAVVCGAPNVEAGQKYPFATLGTLMSNGLEIKPIKLRGVLSQGMLCSAKELEFSEEASGLFTLSPDLKTGQPLAKALGLDDVIFEIKATPNRGDTLSHWGIARELSALFGLKNEFPKLFSKRKTKKSRADLKIELKDAKACPRYTASQIFGVTVIASPDWLTKRLESLGVRSINNIVDATNYIMLLTGHPVHAFDANDIQGHRILIETLPSSKPFRTLDGVERHLIKGDLTIVDARSPVALAGIMGGENSEVKSHTKDLILEVAFFHPDPIRKTARRLGIQSESSYRFERFVNPDSVLQAHELLQDFILTLAGGEPSEIQDRYPKVYKPQKISLPAQEIKRILGIDLQKGTVIKILTALSCHVKSKKGNYEVTVPVFRSDLTRPIDLIEELARLYGLDQIPAEMPSLALRSPVEGSSAKIAKDVKDIFVNFGFFEAVHYSFGEEKDFRKVLSGPEISCLKLVNPISEDLSVMRPSLLPALLRCYRHNHLKSEKGLRLFEFQRVYLNQEKKTQEKEMLTGVYGGESWPRNRFGLKRKLDFSDGKAWILEFFRRARLAVTISPCEDWPYHPGQCVSFFHDDQNLGRLGALHPELLQDLKIKDPLFAFELDFDVIANLYQKKPICFENVPSLPPVYRDLALLIPNTLTHREILDVIEKEKPKELRKIEIFDLYEGDSLPADKKSIAYSITYEPQGESLTDEEVNRLHFALVERLKAKLGVELR